MIKTGKYSDMISGSDQQSKFEEHLSNIREIQLSELKDHFEDDKQIYGSTDPRSDKSVDHKYWLDLLWNAWHLDRSLNSLYYLFHGIRCGGGELTLTKDSFRLLQGEWSTNDWDAIKRENLGPVKDRLVDILKLTRVGKVSDEQLPEGLFDGVDGEMAPAAEVVGTSSMEQVEQGRMFG